MTAIRRTPPLPLVIPSLTYLLFEGWLLFTAPSAPRTLRFTMVSILVVGVVRGNRIAIPLWMLGNLFGALMCFTWSFSAARMSAGTSFMFAALGAAALLNVGYLFFGRSMRDFTAQEVR